MCTYSRATNITLTLGWGVTKHRLNVIIKPLVTTSRQRYCHLQNKKTTPTRRFTTGNNTRARWIKALISNRFIIPERTGGCVKRTITRSCASGGFWLDTSRAGTKSRGLINSGALSNGERSTVDGFAELFLEGQRDRFFDFYWNFDDKLTEG